MGVALQVARVQTVGAMLVPALGTRGVAIVDVNTSRDGAKRLVGHVDEQKVQAPLAQDLAQEPQADRVQTVGAMLVPALGTSGVAIVDVNTSRDGAKRLVGHV